MIAALACWGIGISVVRSFSWRQFCKDELTLETVTFIHSMAHHRRLECQGRPFSHKPERFPYIASLDKSYTRYNYAMFPASGDKNTANAPSAQVIGQYDIRIRIIVCIYLAQTYCSKAQLLIL
jgi:hypothetical protein